MKTPRVCCYINKYIHSINTFIKKNLLLVFSLEIFTSLLIFLLNNTVWLFKQSKVKLLLVIIPTFFIVFLLTIYIDRGKKSSLIRKFILWTEKKRSDESFLNLFAAIVSISIFIVFGIILIWLISKYLYISSSRLTIIVTKLIPFVICLELVLIQSLIVLRRKFFEDIKFFGTKMEKLLITKFPLLEKENLEKIINNIDSFLYFRENKYAKLLLLFFILGVLVYSPIITHWLPNADSINELTVKNGHSWENSLGRVGIGFIDRLHDNFVLPTATTIFCIFLLSIICILIIKLFNKKNGLSNILIGVLILFSPTTVSILTYYYTSDSYFIAFLCATLAALCLTAEKKWSVARILISIGLMVFSLCLYQAFIFITISLCLLFAIINLLNTGSINKTQLRNVAIWMLSGIFSVAIYLILIRFLQHQNIIKLTDGRGFSKMGGIDFSLLPQLVKSTYIDFYRYYFTDYLLNNSWQFRGYLNVIVFLLIISIITIKITNQKIYKSAITLLVLLLGLICFPIALMGIIIIAPQTDIYSTTGLLMLPCMNLIYVFLMLLLNSLDFKTYKNIFLHCFARVSGIVIVYIMILYVFIFQNLIQINLNQTYSTAIRVVSQIEEQFGSDVSTIMVYGDIKSGSLTSEYKKYDNVLHWSVATYGFFWPDITLKQRNWVSFLKHYVGVSYNPCNTEQYQAIINTEEFTSMNTFPDENSIEKINGIVVIKLNK